MGVRADKQAQLNEALHHAARAGWEYVIPLLLKSGADPAHRDSDGWTALHGAIYRRHWSVAKALLKTPGDWINFTIERNTTALMMAVGAHNNSGVVRALVEAGADVSIRNSDGQNVLDLGHVEHRALLQRALVEQIARQQHQGLQQAVASDREAAPEGRNRNF